MNPNDDAPHMNHQDHPVRTLFEQQLHALAPRSVEVSEVEAMYACGFRAGRESALAEPLSKPSLPPTFHWRPLVLAACLACFLVGPASYWMGRIRSQGGVESVLVRESGGDGVLPEPATSTELENKQIEIPPVRIPAKWPASNALLADRAEQARDDEAMLVTSRLSLLWHTFAGMPREERIVDASSASYLTSRSIHNLQSVLEQIDMAADRVEAGANSDSDSTATSSDPSAGQRLRYLDGFRVPLTSDEASEDLMQWMN